MSKKDDEIERLEKEVGRIRSLLMDSMYANAKANEARSRVMTDNERLQAETIRLSKANKRLRKTMVSLALRVWKPQSQEGAE